MDGNQFTTPLILVLNYWLCYVVLQMCILKKTSLLKSSYSASWGLIPITVEEFCNYIALLFYMSIVTYDNYMTMDHSNNN